MKLTNSTGIALITAIFLSISVSAFWPFDSSINANVVSDISPETIFQNETGYWSSCIDTDSGTFASVPGIVFTKISTKGDRCTGSDEPRTYTSLDGTKVKGYPKIIEYYCSTGRKQAVFTSTELGNGYCVSEKLDIEGKIVKSAKWVALQSSCAILEDGVRDQAGKIYKNSCGRGAERLNYTSYSCSADNVAVIAETVGCPVRCGDDGCEGMCTETDAENEKDVPGVVTLDGTNYPDVCVRTDRVKQHKCSNGKLKVITYGDQNAVSCGANRECVTDQATGAGYCTDKYAGSDLAADVAALKTRVSSLETALCSLNNTFSFCSSS